MLLRRRKNPLQLIGRNGGGGAAAHVSCANAAACLAHQRSGELDLADQRLHIGLRARAVADLAAGEGAIQAARGTEGDTDVQIKLIGRRIVYACLHLQNLAQQSCFLRGYEVALLHRLLCLGKRHAAIHCIVRQPGGTDARQRTQRRIYAGYMPQQQERRRFRRALHDALLLDGGAICSVNALLDADFAAARRFQPFAVCFGVLVGQLHFTLVGGNGRIAVKQPDYVVHICAEIRQIGDKLNHRTSPRMMVLMSAASPCPE